MNDETYGVALWLDNNEYAYNRWQARAEQLLDEIEDRDEAAEHLANELYDEYGPKSVTLQSCFPAIHRELLDDALDKVDWDKIAGAWIDTVIENRKEA